jgi:HK97 family phage major capsid protein
MTPQKIKELYEKRAEIAGVIKQLAQLVNDEQRDFTGEEQGKWEAANADYNLLSRQIEVGERELEVAALDVEPANNPGGRIGRDDADGRNTAGDRPAGRVARALGINAQLDYETRDLALRAWFGTQLSIDIPDEWTQAARRCGIRPEAQVLEIPLANTREFSTLQRRGEFPAERAQSVGTDSAGGYMVPEGFVPALERALLAFGGMRQVSDVIRTASGNDLPWPTVDDTSNTGRLLAENTTITETAITFGQFILNAYKYSSDLVLVSAELIQDSAIDIGATVGSILGERLGRILNAHFTTGTGSSQPNGVVTASTLGVTTAPAGSLDELDVINLIHSVDPAYRPGARFMCNDAIVAELRVLQDSNGQFLWQPSLQLGVPDRLAGYPVVVNQQMVATTTTGDKSLLFGDFTKYKIREVAGIRMRRLVERYADDDQEGFVAFLRADGDLLDAGTAPVKHAIIG